MITCFNKWYPIAMADNSNATMVRFDHYKTASGKYAIRLLTGYGFSDHDKDFPRFAAMPKIKYRASKHLARRTAFQLLAEEGLKDSLISAFDDLDV